MQSFYKRHDISDKIWSILEPHLPGKKGLWGGIARDNRLFINAVFWILRTGASWRDLPPDYGDWKNTHRRFCRWRDKGTWEILLEKIIDEPDYEWLMIDASHAKVHPHAAGAKGGNQDMARTKRDLYQIAFQKYYFGMQFGISFLSQAPDLAYSVALPSSYSNVLGVRASGVLTTTPISL